MVSQFSENNIGSRKGVWGGILINLLAINANNLNDAFGTILIMNTQYMYI